MSPRRSLLITLLAVEAIEFSVGACSLDESTAPSAPATPASPGLDIASTGDVLVGAGNIARCDGTKDEATATLLDNIPGTVFTTGDNARASGSATDFTNCYGPSWGRHKARTRPTPGDYDYQTAGATGYFGYFGSTAGDPGKGYYSYDLGEWHIVALNSNISMTAGSVQEQWLKADLAASTKQCTLAYWHHPRFSSRGQAKRSEVKPLWDALYAAGADVVLNAHYRLYERFAPQKPDGTADPANGIRQITVGTAGQGTEPFGSIAPNSEARSSGVYGVLKLTLSTGGYSWEFIPIAGQSYSDAGSASCHAARRAASVEVTPASATIQIGQTVQLSATVKDDQGIPISRPVTWTSSNAAVATVSSSGLVTGVAQGAATITATSDGQTGASGITVNPAPPPPPPGSPVVVGAGDIASCDETGDEATAVLLDGISGTVYTLGDNAYPNGTVSEFTNCYGPSWGRHKARTRPVPGNHDYNTANATGYFGYFGSAAGDPSKGYYSYNLGEWHIIVLNDNINVAAGSTQEQWLRADLATNDKQCTLAMWHHPRFTSVSGRSTAAHVKPLWDALYEAGADLILNGHDHLYERYAPQKPDATPDPTFGIRQITAGTGGQSLYAIGTPAANSEVRDNTSRGVLKVSLVAGSYSWEFIPIAGRTFTDKGTGNCHGAPGSSTNQPPVSNPGGPYTGSESSPISFNGSGSSDPDNNTPLTYAWNFGDGTTGTGATPTHAYAQNGSYTVSLVVTDSRGGSSAPATTTATIANVAPTVNAGADASLGVGETLGLNATFSDPGASDGPWAYSIDWGDGSTDNGNSSSQASPITASHSYAATGQFTVRVTVTDKDGDAATDDLIATVSSTPPANEAPAARPGGPYSGTEGSPVSFNGTGSSDPDNNTPLTYAWNFGDGTTGTGATPSHAYAQNGSATVTLTVTDSKGLASSPATTTTTIANVGPQVNAGPDVSLAVGAALNLSASFTDPGADDSPWTYTIDWGDGATTNGSRSTQGSAITASHSYGTAGQYTVSVTVTDKDGAAGSDALVATVSTTSSVQVLVGASNIATCSNTHDENTAKLIDDIAGTIVALGDNAFPNATTADYTNCYHPTWGRHLARTYGVMGNHEYDTGTASAAFTYYGSRAGPASKGFYSFDLGDWHVIVLNANGNSSSIPVGAGSEQELWLKADLAANTKRCTIAMWHQERFFSSNTAGWTSSSSIKILWEDLYAAGADLVLNGQRHQYERFAPQTPTGVRDDATGIRQFIVGTGGESVGASAVIAPNSEVLAAARGVLKLTLGAGTYSWQFIPSSGYTFTDYGSGTCH
jgi:acid phosphatase type 7